MSENTDLNKTSKGNVKKITYITFFALAMMNVANVGTGNNVQLAFFGLSGISFYAVAALLFFLPTGLVAAELASGWPERGGIFRWVGEALGPGFGFACLLILWFQFIFNYGSSMSANAATIGFYTPNYDWAVKFAQNPKYVGLIMTGWLLYYWIICYLGTKGIKFLSGLVKWGALIGMVLPFVLEIILLVVWLAQGHKPAIDYNAASLIPKWNGMGTLSMAAIVLFSFSGIDMNAAYIKRLKKPRKEYPKAMFLSMIFCFALMCIGLLIIETIVPVKDLNIMFTNITVMRELGSTIGAPWLYMIFMYLGFFTSLASGLVGMAGPSYMLGQAAQGGFLPKSLQKMNKHGMPARLMFIGMAIITGVSYLVLFLPNVEGFVELGVQAITILYLCYYILMFITFLRLRYTQPNRPRAFKIPGGNILAWLIATVGLISCLFGIVIAFYPPAQLSKEVGSGFTYVVILASMVVAVFLVAFIVYRLSKKHNWADPTSQFAPFTWQIEGLKKPQKVTSNIPTEVLSEGQNPMGMPIKRPFSPTEQVKQPVDPAPNQPPVAATEKTSKLIASDNLTTTKNQSVPSPVENQDLRSNEVDKNPNESPQQTKIKSPTSLSDKSQEK